MPTLSLYKRAREQRFRRSLELVTRLDVIRHTPVGSVKVISRKWLWAGSAFSAVGAGGLLIQMFLSRVEWVRQLFDTHWWVTPLWILGFMVVFVGGTVVAIRNIPDGRYRMASQAIELSAPRIRVLTVVVVSVYFVFAAVVAATLAFTAPMELAEWLVPESESESEQGETVDLAVGYLGDAKSMMLGAFFVAAGFFLASALIVTSLSTHPLISLRHTGLRRPGRATSWQSILLGLSGAMIVLAAVAGGVRIVSEEPLPQQALIALAVTLVTGAIVLTGQHAAETRRRWGRAIEILEELSASLLGRTPAEQYREKGAAG